MTQYLSIAILIALLIIIGNYSPFILSLILIILGLIILANTVEL